MTLEKTIFSVSLVEGKDDFDFESGGKKERKIK